MAGLGKELMSEGLSLIKEVVPGKPKVKVELPDVSELEEKLNELYPQRIVKHTQSQAEAPATETPLPKPPEIALEAHSLDYQLDILLDDLQHLETEHLPDQGRLQGLPCDCIAKAARDLRRHARETIPIVAREGKEATIFSEMAAEGEHLIKIGTVKAVRSGLYDAEYLKHAGTISNYRKAVESMRGELSQPCPECATLKELSREYQKQREGRGK